MLKCFQCLGLCCPQRLATRACPHAECAPSVYRLHGRRLGLLDSEAGRTQTVEADFLVRVQNGLHDCADLPARFKRYGLYTHGRARAAVRAAVVCQDPNRLSLQALLSLERGEDGQMLWLAYDTKAADR
jgi:hypothetical protein